jgi:predicted nucleic acid-binding Zn ribbon protein
MISDYNCKHCGNSENDVLIKNSEEVVLCKICNEPMERTYSVTKFTPLRKGTPYPTHLIGGGNRASFGILD